MQKLFLGLMGLSLMLNAATLWQVLSLRKFGLQAICVDLEQAEEEEFEERGKAIDEGFENIMRFSVKGRSGLETD